MRNLKPIIPFAAIAAAVALGSMLRARGAAADDDAGLGCHFTARTAS